MVISIQGEQVKSIVLQSLMIVASSLDTLYDSALV
jgi:hypothetical protein